MGYRSPGRPPEARLDFLRLMTAVVLIAALGAVSLPAFAHVEVEVDGVKRAWVGPMTAADVFAQGWHVSSAGDLVDRNGEMVARGRGASPELSRDGVRLALDTPLQDGDVITSATGADVAESETVTEVVDPITIRYVGEGPLQALEHPGSVGVKRQAIGSASARVFADEVIEPAQPMVIRRHGINGGRQVVALTFDDGPWPGQTDAILRVLAAEDVRATFFMVGSQVRRHPDITRRVRDAGHAIGNHTQAHSRLDVASASAVRNEVTQAQQAIQEVAGVEPRWFRPPGGRTSALVNKEVARFDMRTAMWTVDPQDWRKPPASRIVADVLAGVRPGAVVLLHDGGGERATTIEALGPLIRELKKRGYTFVTLDELP